jgi:hypothetical protein
MLSFGKDIVAYDAPVGEIIQEQSLELPKSLKEPVVANGSVEVKHD